MFSAGNINEKLRVGSFDCREQTVVDMFAGKQQGYSTTSVISTLFLSAFLARCPC